ncbi:MAG: PQQ-dependent sugar dehydrogenase [Actinomycetota bacterium]|nr:PQQ-dependent sugar dehydrogenase [Actinomycetota bacterium]
MSSHLRHTLGAALALAFAAAIASPAAQAAPPTGDGVGGFALTQVGEFESPIHADNAPGTKHTLYVAEQEGVVKVLRGATVLPQPFLDIRDLVRCCGEEGLLSIAFHPKYRKNRLFYVYFNNDAGDIVVMEFRRKKKRKFVALRSSGRRVLSIPHPTNDNHNGGQISFGPDGLLYLAPGDGGAGGDPLNNAQNPEVLLGKILRIDPRKQPSGCKQGKRNKKGKRKVTCFGPYRPYGIPRDNPYAGGPGRDEVYALGLRNPFRFSFDALSGAIAIGDVGQNCIEEIDYLPRGAARGANFGWSRFEGTHLVNAARLAPNAVGPIHQYDNSRAVPGCPNLDNGFEGASVIAGYVVRDERLSHQYGRLLYGDAFNAQIRTLIPFAGGALDERYSGIQLPGASTPFAFAEGFRNRLFVLAGNGPVFRMDPP